MTKTKDDLKIPDTETGELLPIEMSKETSISAFLTDLDFKVKKLTELSKKIKKTIEPTLKFEDSLTGQVAYCGKHTIIKFYTSRFSTKLLEKDGSSEEKQYYDNLKNKFNTLTETIRWG